MGRSPIATWFEDSEMQVRRNFRIGFVVVATRRSPASPLALPYIAGISVDGQDSGRSCHRIGALAGRLPHAPAPRRFEWRSHRDGQVIPSRARRLSPGRRRRSCCRTSPPRTEKSTGTPPSPPGNKAAESSRCCSPISICFAMRLYWILHLDAVF